MGPAMKGRKRALPLSWKDATVRQAQVHRAMIHHQRNHNGQAITVRGLQDIFGIGNPNGIYVTIKLLRLKGLVVKEGTRGKGHYVAIPGPGLCPACGQTVLKGNADARDGNAPAGRPRVPRDGR
jgi:hypothetical protein